MYHPSTNQSLNRSHRADLLAEASMARLAREAGGGHAVSLGQVDPLLAALATLLLILLVVA